MFKAETEIEFRKTRRLMSPHDVLIAGAWRVADSSGEFQAENPATKTVLDGAYPVSRWSDCDAALCSAVEAWEAMRGMPRDSIARFLEVFADRIDGRKDELSSMANLETALPVAPRLADIGCGRLSRRFVGADHHRYNLGHSFTLWVDRPCLRVWTQQLPVCLWELVGRRFRGGDCGWQPGRR